MELAFEIALVAHALVILVALVLLVRLCWRLVVDAVKGFEQIQESNEP